MILIRDWYWYSSFPNPSKKYAYYNVMPEVIVGNKSVCIIDFKPMKATTIVTG